MGGALQMDLVKIGNWYFGMPIWLVSCKKQFTGVQMCNLLLVQRSIYKLWPVQFACACKNGIGYLWIGDPGIGVVGCESGASDQAHKQGHDQIQGSRDVVWYQRNLGHGWLEVEATVKGYCVWWICAWLHLYMCSVIHGHYLQCSGTWSPSPWPPCYLIRIFLCEAHVLADNNETH